MSNELKTKSKVWELCSLLVESLKSKAKTPRVWMGNLESRFHRPGQDVLLACLSPLSLAFLI